MLVIIKSGPDTPEARQALDLAAAAGADVCLIQNAVGLCSLERRAGASGNVYALAEDLTLRGLKPTGGVQIIDYDRLVDLMTESDQVVGMF